MSIISTKSSYKFLLDLYKDVYYFKQILYISFLYYLPSKIFGFS